MVADRGEMEIILNNLLSNAVKYNREGGRIDVTLEPTPETLTLRVADTGIGMTAEEVAVVFNDFARARNERTRHIPGSGLGLSIVKRLAALYGGDASVESAPDAGTTLTVTLARNLPLPEPEPEPASPAVASA
jgi:signal transduction histidine kinase